MASVSTKPWGSISESDYTTPEAFCSACLIDTNPPGSKKTKDKCKLPYKEPGGAINRNGVIAAANALVGGRGGVNASPADKKSAARTLVRLYGRLKMSPPPSLRSMAS